MKDVKYFKSDNELSRLDYLKRSLVIIILMLLTHLLYIFRFPNKAYSAKVFWIAALIMGGGLLIWNFTSIIVKQIFIDYDQQKFFVHYMTIFNNNKTIEVPLQALTFKFEKKPTRNHPKKWTLSVFNMKQKVFSLDTNENGFSQDTLEKLVEQLNGINKSSD